MKLKQFHVTTFRSVEDSDWIEADNVTALIGVNESGKTNLLLPLWKLKPARDGEIQPTSDYPKTMFGEIRSNPGDYRWRFRLMRSQHSGAWEATIPEHEKPVRRA